MIKAYTTSLSSRVSTQFHFGGEPVTQDDQLIRQAQKGNLEAFNQLVLLYQNQVFRQAMWILNDQAAAEDATQEAFLRAYSRIDTFRGGPLRPWLLRIVTNYCLDQLRYTQRRPSQPLVGHDEQEEDYEPAWLRDQNDSPEQAVERSELTEDIIESVKKLAWEYRMPIILVDLQDLDYEEASTIMHIPLGTFKSRLARARQKLSIDFQKKSLTGKMQYAVS